MLFVCVYFALYVSKRMFVKPYVVVFLLLFLIEIRKIFLIEADPLDGITRQQ